MNKPNVVVIGAGFTGLSVAYSLAKKGISVRILEADSTIGGLAGTFTFKDGTEVEKFYHHWFNHDIHVKSLINDIGMSHKVMKIPSRTGMYLNGRIWKLSSPLDLLLFKPLPFLDRLRLGWVTLKIRRIKDWKSLEVLSVKQWLVELCGQRIYKTVWEPLVNAKFGKYSEVISAVWMWKKLVLRGSTRNRAGKEELLYYKGGFGALAHDLKSKIENQGGKFVFDTEVLGVEIDSNLYQIAGLKTNKGQYLGDFFVFTTPLPVLAQILETSGKGDTWVENLKKIPYLGNICLILKLRNSLSSTYWLNVNDPSFPFVGVIEHTNLDTPENYNNSHIVYLSRYIDASDPIFQYSDADYFNYAVRHIKQMFPDFNLAWVLEYTVWKSQFAQPVTVAGYSSLIPKVRTPLINTFICTMAQIYPEDRGTNYAIRDGEAAANLIINQITDSYDSYRNYD